MYKSIYYDRNNNQIHLWTDGKHDDKPYECFKYEKYAYVVDSDGKYRTLNDLKVKRTKFWNKQQEEQGMVFEHDVSPETRVLIDRYSKYDEVSTDVTVLFYDIEVERGVRYSKPSKAFNPINAISYYDNVSKQYCALLLDRDNVLVDRTLEDGTIFKRFTTEEQLLLHFLEQWNLIQPDIVTGWNCDYYDNPYLYQRLVNLFGEETACLLSPIRIVNTKEYRGNLEVSFAGISSMDYLKLFIKFKQSEQPNFKLETISQLVLGRGKIQYEGSLDDLYKTDIDKFIQYNVNDVELVVALDKKLNYINIGRGLCHKGHVPYDYFKFSSFYLDGAILKFAKTNDRIIFKVPSKYTGKAVGAFVKDPAIGIHELLYSIDLQSLYPSIIRTCNISPETQIAVIKDWDRYNLVSKVILDGRLDIEKYSNFGYLPDDIELEVTTIANNLFDTEQTYKLTKNEFVKYITDNKYSISGAGVIFDTQKSGIVPDILTKWFNERIEYKGKAAENSNNPELFAYYDNLQLIIKILLNSLYGVLLLPTFRYYDRRNGESTTLTGQSIIKFTDSVITEIYRKMSGDSNLPSPVIYQDSDSAYVDIKPLIPNYLELPDEVLYKTIDEISDNVLKIINSSIAWLSAHHLHSSNNQLLFLKEKIIKRGVWIDAKKRYALLTIDPVSLKEKVIIKGFDSVRSDFPKYFRTALEGIIKDILYKVPTKQINAKIRQIKKDYVNAPIEDVMVPNSVKEYSKYKRGQLGTPINVKSAQNYNTLLTIFNKPEYSTIEDGDKIMYAYLVENPFQFETMALRGDDPEEIINFVNKYIDKQRIFETKFLTKVESIWNDLKFGKLDLKSKQNNYF